MILLFYYHTVLVYRQLFSFPTDSLCSPGRLLSHSILSYVLCFSVLRLGVTSEMENILTFKRAGNVVVAPLLWIILIKLEVLYIIVVVPFSKIYVNVNSH